MTETARAMMSDAEVMAIHQDYIDKHKKAFRVAFDMLNRLWPPKNTVEWWSNVAIPDMTLVYDDAKDNPLAQALVLAIAWYLEQMGKALQGEMRREEDEAGESV